MSALDPVAARRVLRLLTVTRWLPVGLTVAIVLLRPLEKGLTVAQVLTVTAVVGVVTVLLELPTSGFADAFGRRVVLVAAAVVNLAASVLFVLADALWTFVVVKVLMGLFRALDSGPLESWYVDTVHAHRPGADVDQELSAVGSVLGASIALGALASGLLVWWAPLGDALDGSPLTLPLVLAAALGTLHLVALVVLLREPPRPRTGTRRAEVAAGVRAVPAVVRSGLGVARRSRALRGLLAAEAALAVAMVGFESMVPLRLAELLGSTDRAGVVMGVAAAVGWAVFAAGAALGGLLSRRLGLVRAAVLTHLMVGAGVVVIGLATGPAGVVAGYLATYGVFGGVGPLHSSLVHREAEAGNRSTVLSLGSMVSFGVFALVAPLTGLLAARASSGLAVLALGGLCLLGAAAYRPARAAERARASGGAPPAEAGCDLDQPVVGL